MTYDELNALLEAVANEPTNDVLMLENFDKVREYVKDSIAKMSEMIQELENSKSEYEKLRESKVRDFFNSSDDSTEEVVEEVVEETVEDENDITVEDLFDEDVEVVEDIELKEEEE